MIALWTGRVQRWAASLCVFCSRASWFPADRVSCGVYYTHKASCVPCDGVSAACSQAEMNEWKLGTSAKDAATPAGYLLLGSLKHTINYVTALRTARGAALGFIDRFTQWVTRCSFSLSFTRACGHRRRSFSRNVLHTQKKPCREILKWTPRVSRAIWWCDKYHDKLCQSMLFFPRRFEFSSGILFVCFVHLFIYE